MKKLKIIFSLVLIISALTAQTPAFPGAEGGGMYTTGGRGGKVLYVTSLADDGSSGTFRWAINQSGARIIEFKVSGLIELKSNISIKNGNLTIAGQTAPGDGICFKDYDITVDGDNIIIRYIRVRLGNGILSRESDAIGGRYQKNIILDHCSFSWSIDECASFYSNENFTMQWCFITESLNNAGHSKGAHGYGGLWGGKNASFHHNLIAHHNSRNPRFNGWKRSGLSYTNPQDEERLDFRNNVIYNWGDNSSYGGEALGKYNMVANYFKYGPGTKSSIKSKITQVDIDADIVTYAPGFGQYFIRDNYVYGNTSVTNDNWTGVTYASGVNQTSCRADVPFQSVSISQHTAIKAFEKVMEYGGASLSRDTIDRRIVREAKEGTATYSGYITNRPGLIDTPDDVGGWPEYNSTMAPADSNADGIPDGWLETNYPGKTSTNADENGYTYLDLYLASLVQTITENQNSEAIISGIFLPEINSNKNVTVNYQANSKNLQLESSFNIKIISIFDYAGRLIKTIPTNAQKVNLDVNDLKKSVYIIKATLSNSTVTTIKIVI
ncbi:MAG: pectate lyase [Paludibacter sp.]|nr:pectate lyase [Paludibacter sp.]